MRRAGDGQERIAVGLGILHRHRRDGAAADRAVLDHDLLVEALAHRIGIDAGGDVGDAAGAMPTMMVIGRAGNSCAWAGRRARATATAAATASQARWIVSWRSSRWYFLIVPGDCGRPVRQGQLPRTGPTQTAAPLPAPPSDFRCVAASVRGQHRGVLLHRRLGRSPRSRSAWPCPRPTRSARACGPAPSAAPRPCARPG